MIDPKIHRELFVDSALLESLDGARLRLCEPRIETIPSAGGIYNTVLYDNARYRLYYRGTTEKGMPYSGNPAERVGYAESRDGFTFVAPDLGTAGGKNGEMGNVIYDEPALCHNFSPFMDSRAGIPPEERYKAVSGIWHNNYWRIRQDGGDLPEGFEGGLHTFASADGVNWRRTSEKPVITCPWKAFDSQNVAFWSESENVYVCYFRTWGPGGFEKGLRSISRATSPDFVNWSETVDMHPNGAPEELYTSQTAPYFRAPHIYLAFPTRYMRDRDSSTDILFMSTRGGDRFDRTFRDPLFRPGLDPARWKNRANYASVNLVPLDAERMCFYVFSRGAHSKGNAPALRLVFRTDGIAALSAGWRGGTALTKPVRVTGSTLELNYSTSAAGLVRCELLGEDGSKINGLTLEDFDPLVGDEISRRVTWRGGDLASLAEARVRIRFVLLEADVFSYGFVSNPT